MARALRAWAINRGGKKSVRNLRYGRRTRLVRGMYFLPHKSFFDQAYAVKMVGYWPRFLRVYGPRLRLSP